MESAIQLVIDQICSFNFGDIEFIPIKTKAPELDLDDFYNYITKPAEDASYAKDDNNKVYVDSRENRKSSLISRKLKPQLNSPKMITAYRFNWLILL